VLPQAVTTIWRTELGTTLLFGFNSTTGGSAYFHYLCFYQSAIAPPHELSSSPIWTRATRALYFWGAVPYRTYAAASEPGLANEIMDDRQETIDGFLQHTRRQAKLDLVAQAIHDITAKAADVKTLVDAVKTGSTEQARGIEQIAQAIGQMERVTQLAAAHAEQSDSAGEQLSAQAISTTISSGS